MPGHERRLGIFGENLTVEGMLEDEVHIGDRFAVGSAEVVVTQPRLPCYKLGVRLEADDLVKLFFESRRTGFYVAVTSEGKVAAGDAIARTARGSEGVSVADITRLYAEKRYSEADFAVLRRALKVAALPESWTEYLRERLGRVPRSE